MERRDQLEDLIRILIQLTARSVFPEDRLREIVVPLGTSGKQLTAYNLCDGSRTQADVARKAKIDRGNFNRTVTRWVRLGAMHSIGSGRDARLLHLYPLSKHSE